MPFQSVNPATGEVWRSFEELSDEQLEAKLDCAAQAFHQYRQTDFAARASGLKRVADVLDARREELARLMTREMGKPVQAARDEAAKCAKACRFYAEHGPAMLTDEPVETEAKRSYISYEPLGPILAVMPWNFPFWQAFRFIAPMLMAGNVGVLKHSSNVPGCALAIEEVLREAGFSEGVFQTLLVSAERAEMLLDDKRIKAATLTGSEGAGRALGAASGHNLKKIVLELGGSDPFIVMPSADLDQAIETAVKARLLNNGQSCIAAKRFIVHSDIYDAFRDGFVERMKKIRVGDPMDAATELGPLATAQIRDDLHEQVEKSIQAGARLLCGGQPIEGAGFFYQATALENIPRDAPALAEETFGPVAALCRVESFDEALGLANDTQFGLGAALWSHDENEVERFVREIESGNAFVNAMVASNPAVPFGGIKASGIGRELSVHGPREFMNIKTVWID